MGDPVPTIPTLNKEIIEESDDNASMISPMIEPSPPIARNVYRPKCSDISEDDQSDMEKLNSPRIAACPQHVQASSQASPNIPKRVKSPAVLQKSSPGLKSPSAATKSPRIASQMSPPNIPNMKCSVRVRKLPIGKEMLEASNKNNTKEKESKSSSSQASPTPSIRADIPLLKQIEGISFSKSGSKNAEKDKTASKSLPKEVVEVEPVAKSVSK